MPDPDINPYNFSDFVGKPNRRAYPSRRRFDSDRYQGTLVCRLRTVTALFTAEQRPELATSNALRFLRNGANRPMIAATSLKGMLRTVYESVFSSCVPIASKTRLPSGFENSACDSPQSLCPACRLFGTTGGDDLHCEGRLRLTDAVLDEGQSLSACRSPMPLPYLSSPHPEHYPIYTPSRGRAAGRKHYYHHAPSMQDWISGQLDPPGNTRIVDFAMPSSTFSFELRFDDLSEDELAGLRRVIELDTDLAHKLGMARAQGLGSCTIEVLSDESVVECAGDRFRRFGSRPALCWSSLVDPASIALPGSLVEVLRLNKETDGRIGYPSWATYNNSSNLDIDHKGRFPWADRTTMNNTSAASLAMPAPEHEANAADPAQAHEPAEREILTTTGPAPAIRGDGQAMQLKKIEGEWLTFVGEDGACEQRPISKIQGSGKVLIINRWFQIWGTSASKPIN